MDMSIDVNVLLGRWDWASCDNGEAAHQSESDCNSASQ